MPNMLDQVLVLDFQFTCWAPEKTPRREFSEVIEIGVCRLDLKKGMRTTRHRILVKPTSSSVSAYCTEQTGISRAELKKGRTFKEACDVLKNEFQGRERPWATWGSHERMRLRRQLAEERIRMPLGSSHITIKTLMALVHNLPHEPKLDEALDRFGIEPIESPYVAECKAWGAAGILHSLIGRDMEAAPSGQQAGLQAIS